MAVEGWGFRDSLYMPIIAISTVGYHEVRALSEAARWVTYGVLLGGLSWLALRFATVTAFFIESDVFQIFRFRRMEREIAALKVRIARMRMASILLRPGVMSLLEVMTRGGRFTLSIEELPVAAGSGLVGRTLRELGIPQRRARWSWTSGAARPARRRRFSPTPTGPRAWSRATA